MVSDDVRAELKALGERRARRDEEDVELTKEINAALAKISKANIAKTEAADLLGVHRTTLYRVYKV
jgi:transcriptional regulator of acetoin/glycerol metabolism